MKLDGSSWYKMHIKTDSDMTQSLKTEVSDEDSHGFSLFPLLTFSCCLSGHYFCTSFFFFFSEQDLSSQYIYIHIHILLQMFICSRLTLARSLSATLSHGNLGICNV